MLVLFYLEALDRPNAGAGTFLESNVVEVHCFSFATISDTLFPRVSTLKLCFTSYISSKFQDTACTSVRSVSYNLKKVVTCYDFFGTDIVFNPQITCK